MNQESVDFDQLASTAFPEVDQLGPVEALDKLWRSLFDLEKWYFLAQMPGPDSEDEPKPYHWDRKMDGEHWLLVFTDLERAQKFAVDQNLADDRGNIPFVSMSPDNSREYAKTCNAEVVGIRFNEGSPFGWAGPLGDIEGIYQHLYPDPV